MRIKLTCSYDGSKFKGFQRQNDERSIQKELEMALSNIYNEIISVKGSGRTDKGVHAYNQVVHYDVDKKIKFLKLKLNNILKDIKIKKVKYVQDDFHARFSVKNKTYMYKISLNNKGDSNYYLNIYYDIDIKKMKQASKVFIGTHDFEYFVSGKRDNYESTVFDIKFYHFFNKLYIKFTGVGFYRYMVRNLVGALLSVGRGKVTINELESILDKSLDRRLPTAPSNGLYLVKVRY